MIHLSVAVGRAATVPHEGILYSGRMEPSLLSQILLEETRQVNSSVSKKMKSEGKETTARGSGRI